MTTARVGTKLTEEEVAAIDPSCVAKALDDEVEGQEEVTNIVECPFDGHVFRARVDTEVYRYVMCPVGGHIFRA